MPGESLILFLAAEYFPSDHFVWAPDLGYREKCHDRHESNSEGPCGRSRRDESETQGAGPWLPLEPAQMTPRGPS